MPATSPASLGLVRSTLVHIDAGQTEVWPLRRSALHKPNEQVRSIHLQAAHRTSIQIQNTPRVHRAR